MNIGGYIWISMNIFGLLWIAVDSCGYPWIPVDICGYPWIPVDIYGYSVLWMEFSILISIAFQGISIRSLWISIYLLKISIVEDIRTAKDF